MASKETFEQIIKDCKDHKIVKPLDSVIDYDTTIGEYYEEEIEDLKKDLEVLKILKKYWNFGGILSGWSIDVYKMTDDEYNKVKEWLKNE